MSDDKILTSMIKKAEFKINLAKKSLVEDKCDLSTAASYYTMYYSAMALLYTKDKAKTPSHEPKVIEKFKNDFVNTGYFDESELKSYINAYQEVESNGYANPKISCPETKERCIKTLREAESFIKKTKQLISEYEMINF